VIFPCTAPDLNSARAFLSNVPKEQLQVGGSTVLEGLLKTLPQIDGLTVGDYIHIAVQVRRPGHLRLFNCGSSGDVACIELPNGSTTCELQPGCTSWVLTGATDSSSPCRELGDSEDESLGQANGYPDGILALVTQGGLDISQATSIPNGNHLTAEPEISTKMLGPLAWWGLQVRKAACWRGLPTPIGRGGGLRPLLLTPAPNAKTQRSELHETSRARHRHQ